MNLRCLIVEYVEELGSQRLVHGPYGRTAAEGGRLPETALASELRFVITPQKLHFFAHDTGKRIGADAAITAHHRAVADAIS